MSNFTLKQEGYSGYTTIPNCFIEQFMPYAAGEFVKIYIYLLKCIGENKSELSISKIADAFNNTEKDVVRALKYWQKKGLLKLSFDEENALTSLYVVNLNDSADSFSRDDSQENKTFSVTDAPVPGQPGINTKPRPSQNQSEATVKTAVPTPEFKEVPEFQKAPTKKAYSQSEILAFSNQDDIQQLFYIIQKYLGRSLSGQDIDTVLYLYDTLHFSSELIEYLFEYCVSKNHRSIRYIEKTGLAWDASGIKSVTAAKMMAGIYSDDCYKVMTAFGLNNRKPTKNEADFVSRWTLSYGFGTAIILAACNKTMDQLHQPNFEYTDAILKNWKNSGVLTLEDIQKLDEAFEKSASQKEKKTRKRTVNVSASGSKFNSFVQRSYDYGALEQKLFNQ